MTQYSLFVLKVLLNTSKPNQTSILAQSAAINVEQVLRNVPVKIFTWNASFIGKVGS